MNAEGIIGLRSRPRLPLFASIGVHPRLPLPFPRLALAKPVAHTAVPASFPRPALAEPVAHTAVPSSFFTVTWHWPNLWHTRGDWAARSGRVIMRCGPNARHRRSQWHRPACRGFPTCRWQTASPLAKWAGPHRRKKNEGSCSPVQETLT